MKTLPIITVIALIVSLGAGHFAFKASSETKEEKINAIVDARIAARELKFVETYSPRFREMFAAIDDPEYGANWNPKTLEELCAPLVKITSGMSSKDK